MLQVRENSLREFASRNSSAAGRPRTNCSHIAGAAPAQVRRSRRTTIGAGRGGAIVNIVVCLVFVLLLSLALWWLFKNIGEAGQQYGEALVDTRYTDITVRCQTNMRTIWQNLQMYAATNGSLPESRDALVEWSGNSRLFRCPATDGPEYVYIPGQNEDMPATNILVYEPQAVHDGRCSVLRLGGQIELLTPEELKLAVAVTLANLR